MASGIFSRSDLKYALFDDPHTHLIIFEKDHDQNFGRQHVLMKYVRFRTLKEYTIIYDGFNDEYTTPDGTRRFTNVKEIISWYLNKMGLISHPGTIILINTINEVSTAWKEIPNGLYHIKPPKKD